MAFMLFYPLMPFVEQTNGLDLDYGDFLHKRVKHLRSGFFVKIASGKMRDQVRPKHDNMIT